MEPKLKIDPTQIEIKDFEYDLPDERIARFPLEKRDQSKLLIYKSGEITEEIYHNFADQIPENSLLIFNQAKVVHARLHFQKETGGKLEIFCLEPDVRYHDITTAMAQENEVYWKCLIKGAHKWKDDSPIFLDTFYTDSNGKKTSIKAEAKKTARDGNSFIIHFNWETEDGSAISFSEFLEHAGKIPIPPYLKREAEESDELRYQTIFAKREGSVAAPTSALHFTPYILEQLEKKGIQKHQLTLHVGAGTFMPVKSETMEGHQMHAEWIEFSKSLLQRLVSQIKKEEKVIVIGTTSARTLESAYWIGVQILLKEWHPDREVAVDQWYPYQERKEFSKLEVAQALIDYMEKENLDKIITRTRLIIAPGYEFKWIDALVTNFHQPASTLLLMVSALVGDDWKKIYDYALQNDFRFLSYGDGSLLWKE